MKKGIIITQDFKKQKEKASTIFYNFLVWNFTRLITTPPFPSLKQSHTYSPAPNT